MLDPDQSGINKIDQHRGTAEESLKNKPFVVHYPGRAGVITSKVDANECNTYSGNMGNNIDNLYYPFTSKLEWEIAHWAKLRGPSLMAFTELMKIDGVAEKLGLTFKSTVNLNKIIDNTLPGRPRFVWHEILIGSKVCDVYFRDVIECVRALLGDLNFAPYLVFSPEQHYVDESEQVQVYHDMHTSCWWWKTQEALERNGASGATIIRAVLDFLFLAQYPVHTDDTLEVLEESLRLFHDNKQVFVDLKIRENFNLPKLHFATHYVKKIKLFGTTDNFNMEYTERLHIDFAKEAYKATNHKDEFPQMTVWLERKEKIERHEQYIAWCLAGRPVPIEKEWSPPSRL